MTDLLNEMETALADLLQSGLATCSFGGRFQKLAEDCEARGLHTGAAMMEQIAVSLNNRAHALEKDDLPLTAVIFRAVRYISLCREKQQEETILSRWQHEGGNP